MVTQQPTKMKMMLAVVAVLATMVSGAIPAAFAQEVEGEIAVTGVVSYHIREPGDVPGAVELFRMSYARAKASAERRAAAKG